MIQFPCAIIIHEGFILVETFSNKFSYTIHFTFWILSGTYLSQEYVFATHYNNFFFFISKKNFRISTHTHMNTYLTYIFFHRLFFGEGSAAARSRFLVDIKNNVAYQSHFLVCFRKIRFFISSLVLNGNDGVCAPKMGKIK